MTKDTQAKPSTGALRAADILWREYVIGTPQADGGILFPGTHRLAKIIDRETGMAGLLEAAKEALIVLDELVDEVEDMQEYKLQRPIEERLRQAISKCEGKGSE